ncbi:hypothetical protein AT00_09345 [Pseudoalteromonas lipolytica SCSIO 04301]|uniref:hypothetical protein n=1 Tax=Pseudoalteromonas lipolytica TaxID=570156 RepID=UPI0004462C0A|nr:hypothetical protein [Pseudoalteromonas lipolytica]EWH06647.1 hypothetical protein AT00_09345 [Pseudoalteromonas lipolytica SCSIO 04301]
MTIDSKVIILEHAGFDIYGKNLNALEHVIELKKFIQDKYPKIAELNGFENSFNEFPYDFLGNVQAISDLADQHLGFLVVAM